MPVPQGPPHILSSILKATEHALGRTKRLKKELTLFDVYAISTGAMFSSGFFLLPGLAAAIAGPAVVLAYLIAGILILPAMFSVAELSTAMPRAGGAYYFLDRSLGPMAGTIGGLGTYLALTLKSAFALVGMGAYLAIFIELPIKPLAVGLTLAFMGLNIVGSKETTSLQRGLVVVLLGVLGFFVAQGLFEVAEIGFTTIKRTQLTPFMPFGFEGVLATVGFVFVSYAGLTKVASVAEEVKDPERNIPLGMLLSLATATFVYVFGVFIMVSVLDSDALRTDLTPVATAGEAFFDWLPEPVGLILIVIAAIAAFASTGNAGLMSASRYPYAMAKDRLVPDRFAHLGQFNTPLPAIILTAGLMIVSIVVLSEAGIAKLASAFQLLIFAMINVAVIVMRESRLSSYDPGFRSPLYPWMQVFGIITPFILVGLMGWMPILFTLGVIVLCLVWYYHYAKDRVTRDGAVYHWFERLGRRRYEGVDRELRTIMKEKGLRREDPFDAVVARAAVLDVRGESFEQIADKAARQLAGRIPMSHEAIRKEFLRGTKIGATPVAHGIALPHFVSPDISHPHLVLVRACDGAIIPVQKSEIPDERPTTKPKSASGDAGAPESALPTNGHDDDAADSAVVAYGLFFLVSPSEDPGQHLRMLAKIASRVDQAGFMTKWVRARSVWELREILIHDEHALSITVKQDARTSELAGRTLKDVDWPYGSLVALIERDDDSIIPRGSTIIQVGDLVTVIGDAEAIEKLRRRYSETPNKAD